MQRTGEYREDSRTGADSWNGGGLCSILSWLCCRAGLRRMQVGHVCWPIRLFRSRRGRSIAFCGECLTITCLQQYELREGLSCRRDCEQHDCCAENECKNEHLAHISFRLSVVNLAPSSTRLKRQGKAGQGCRGMSQVCLRPRRYWARECSCNPELGGFERDGIGDVSWVLYDSYAHKPMTSGNPIDRLDSWKEIAGFLRRDVRTVQRWEKKEGLPVYRHQHEKLGSVYAYRPELAAWFTG